MAYTSQSASLPEILTSIVTQLATVTGIDRAYCHLVASDNYEINCSEPKFLFVRPFGLRPRTDAGAGRRARPVYRTIRVYIHTRSELDFYTSDETALTAIGAHEDFELQTVDALDEYWPSDEDDAEILLTIEPLHPLDSSSGPPARKADNDTGILTSYFDYEICYLNKVQTPQP